MITHLETFQSPSFISRKSRCLPVMESTTYNLILKKMEDLELGSFREINHLHHSKASTEQFYIYFNYAAEGQHEQAITCIFHHIFIISANIALSREKCSRKPSALPLGAQ